jgi:hypothetical protein
VAAVVEQQRLALEDLVRRIVREFIVQTGLRMVESMAAMEAERRVPQFSTHPLAVKAAAGSLPQMW